MKIDFRNINNYLESNKSQNSCGHTSTNIESDDFEEIGELYDGSYDYLSYVGFAVDDNKDEFTGAYPLQDCKILKCNRCGQVVFFHYNQGGIAPRPEYFMVDYRKKYLSEPAVKSVTLSKSKLEEFIEYFELNQVETEKNGYISFVKIEHKNLRHIVNYREDKIGNGEIVYFDVVGERKFLRRIYQWLTDNK